jgi:formylglycine-generating enzyme required for sulfatase activity
MKTILKKIIILTFISSFAINFSCQRNDLFNKIDERYNFINNFDAANNTGDRVIGEHCGVLFCYINAKGSGATSPTIFPKGLSDAPDGIITEAFFMSETAVTNELFTEVYQWAYNNGKFNSNQSSAPNNIGAVSAKYGSKVLINFPANNIKFHTAKKMFEVEGGFEEHPVVQVTVYGAIMFCNWLTEIMDGNQNNIVYTGMNEASWDTTLSINVSNTGYRLPTDNEWEYAARYIGKTQPVSPSFGTQVDSYWWTPGNYLSGSKTSYNDPAGNHYNDAVAVYKEYWDGQSTGVNSIAVVGSKDRNQLGIYDMSGNVWEWCYDGAATLSADEWIIRGGSYKSKSEDLQVGKKDVLNVKLPNYVSNDLGFRICRTNE